MPLKASPHTEYKFSTKTRMHSSRMRTAHSSSHHGGVGLGVGLDQIPLNFPLGCGPESDPPQLPPWVWAWIRSPSTSSLGVGLELPQDQAPPDQAPLGPGNPPGTRHSPLDQAPPPGPGTPCGQTHTCKHITLPQTSFAGGNDRPVTSFHVLGLSSKNFFSAKCTQKWLPDYHFLHRINIQRK